MGVFFLFLSACCCCSVSFFFFWYVCVIAEKRFGCTPPLFSLMVTHLLSSVAWKKRIISVFFFFLRPRLFYFSPTFLYLCICFLFWKGREREREWELNINGNIIYLFIFVSIVTCFSFLLVMSKTFFFLTVSGPKGNEVRLDELHVCASEELGRRKIEEKNGSVAHFC